MSWVFTKVLVAGVCVVGLIKVVIARDCVVGLIKVVIARDCVVGLIKVVITGDCESHQGSFFWGLLWVLPR